ncbi:MAG: 23S rRNA (adenine(2503)-C(2))-methyltransferase RlmN [Acidimicrobiales bacterium]
MGRRYDMGPGEIRALLEGEPPFRARQVWHGLYRRLEDPADLTDLPATLRSRLAALEDLGPALRPLREAAADDGATTKWLFGLDDGAEVETVLMRYPDRVTACVSSQAGCAMGCTFCATGQGGFRRHLGVGEIVEQVVRAARAARESSSQRRLSNVVFMGMGEPLANLGSVEPALRRLLVDIGLSARHVTVSTVGLVPGIHRLADARLGIGLAVSLHAANDGLRDELVPINRRWPLAVLEEACQHWLEAGGRRISLEWACMDGVNDRQRDAVELAGLAGRLRAHVNLIPLNPTPGWPVQGSPPERVTAFAATLAGSGVAVSVRQNRGGTIDAACGQLAMRSAPRGLPARRGLAPARIV